MFHSYLLVCVINLLTVFHHQTSIAHFIEAYRMITPQLKTIGIPLIYALESNLSKVYNFCNWIISRLMLPIYQTDSLKFDWELNCFVDFWLWRNSIDLISSRKCVAALDQVQLNCKWSLIISSPHCANKAPPYHIE